MSAHDGGPAFPCSHPHSPGAEGMSLRDWFAGQALVGLMQNGRYAAAQIAESAYLLADAMLKERERER